MDTIALKHKAEKSAKKQKKRSSSDHDEDDHDSVILSPSNILKKKPRHSQSGLLDFYWKLASDDSKERLEAAVGLLKGLNEANSEDDWNYALERLVRGLSSSRGSARLGFSMALSELLVARISHISVWDFLDMISEYFQIPSNISGHEERGLNFGTLFALRTLAQSPLILKDSTTIREFERFVDISLDLASRKVWLRESVFFSLSDLLNRLPGNSFFSADQAIEMTLKKIDNDGISLTSEGVALYLSLDPELRVKFATGITTGWKHGDPLAKGNLPILAKALKEVPTDKEESSTANSKQKGNWKPSLHFVWRILIKELNQISFNDSDSSDDSNKTSKKDKKDHHQKDSSVTKRISLQEFWKTVVDEGFFANSSSSERKYWGFEIFKLFLEYSDSSNVEILFTHNLIRCLINQLSQQDRFLYKAAKSVISVIQDITTNRPEVCFAIINGLLQRVPNFDIITKTKTISSLIHIVPADDLRQLVEIFSKVFVFLDETDEKAIDLRRQWALDSLLNLVKTRRHEQGSSLWIEDIISLLVKFGYFKGMIKEAGGGSEISQATIDHCHSRLNSVLSLTVGTSRDDKKSWAFYALSSILSLEDEFGKELRAEFEGDLLKAKNKSIKTLEKIRKKRSSSNHADSAELEAFELLFSLVLIQVYSTDSEAAGLLDELQMCYNTIIGKSRNQEGDHEGAIDATQVLTEILLSFLSRRSALLRRLSETVWSTFTSKITKGSLQLLFDILETSESSHGQDVLFDNDEDEDEEDDEEQNEDEMDVDKQDKNSDEDSHNDNDSDDDDDNDDDDDDDDDDEDEEDDDSDDLVKEVDRQAHSALAKALGINKDDENEELSSADEEDDDDESMDDEQMMALDEQLAGIFRERQKALAAHKTPNQKKQDALEAKQNMVQFKSRILDLLEIYIKAEPSSPLILSAIPPLLTVIRITKDKPLGDKAHQLLKNKLCKVKELPRISENEVDPTVEILSNIHAQAKRSSNKPHSLACNQTSVFVTKILLLHDKALADRIATIYSSTLSEWMRVSHSKATPAMFFDLVNYIASTKNRHSK